MSFKDHFSGHADRYARYRPDYPPEWFAFLAALAPACGCAWDCGTGNGQAACALAAYFEHVIATDASAQQIAQARPHPGVRYAVAPAEQSGLPAHTADLITVAQALHWFDVERFLAEAQRVGKPGSVLAVWSYGMATVHPAIDAVVLDFYERVVGPYWPPERHLVEAGYPHLTLPGQAIPAPEVAMQKNWTVEELCGYLGTWSAVKNYRKAHTDDPVEPLRPALEKAWGNTLNRMVRWPMQVHLSRLPKAR